MSKKIKHRLNETESQRSVNVKTYDKIGIEHSNRTLPVGELNRVLNVGEQFNKERQGSELYRLSGTINPIFTNILFNTTGPNSYQYLLTNPDFRDRSYPQTGINYKDSGDLTYHEAIREHIKNVDGWLGYIDPTPTGKSVCLFHDMEPRRELFNLAPQNKIKNWDLTITYPAYSANTEMTSGGLLIVESTPVLIGNRPMLALTTPIKHGLSQGDTVRISGLSDSSLDKDYNVVRVGLDNGDLLKHSFVVDVPDTTSITNNARMSRIFGGEETKYYFRKFKKVGTIKSDIIGTSDYEMYPLKFSKTLFNDKDVQFVINEDVDVSKIKDNLGRPISELYLTLIKTDSQQKPGEGGGPIFSNVKSGIESPFINSIQSFKQQVPDIKRISNKSTTHDPLESDVNINDDVFFGDVVSYNKLDVKEVVLGEVRHRFNTVNRQKDIKISDPFGFENDGKPFDIGSRYEGYFYKPHHLITIREFSNYIEQGDDSTAGIPSYAEDLGDGRKLWRDLLEIGFTDTGNNPLDYPFLNGRHYIHQNYCLPLRRQDPFNLYGLYYTGIPRDPFGKESTDKFDIKKSQDAC